MKRPSRTANNYWTWEPEPSLEGFKVHEWHLPIEVFQQLKAGRPYFGGALAYPSEFDAIADYVDAVRATR